DPCIPTTGTGWQIAVDMFTGGRKDGVFLTAITNAEGEIEYVPVTTEDGDSVSGLQSKVGMPRSPILLRAGDIIFGLLPGTGDDGEYIQSFTMSGGGDTGRQSWRQLR
ncbi:hypothetical protein RZS08_20205, partial [Arthrospira platensis SPKY1]|nr:hypothetical protein [Arthrospira platensis SPKY1]